MELPFIIVFEPPSRRELRALLRMRGIWVAGLLIGLAIGILAFLSFAGRAEAVASGASVPLELSSQPSGAGVWLDGHERGTTPLSVLVEPGVHSVVLKAAEAPEARYTVPVGAAGTSFEGVLWRRQPALTRLRPTLPGAVLSDARLLTDGELALSLELPPGRLRQAWRLDARTGAVRALLNEVVSPRLAVAPDGEHIAYVGYEIGPPAPGADPPGFGSPQPGVVWLIGPGDSTAALGWRAPLAPGEGLLDVSWSPQADRLLAISAQGPAAGAVRSRLWLVDADGGHASEALTLPSDVVAGSVLWSPDGQHITFVAHAATVNALCVLDVDGTFRYVADLESSQTPLAYPQVTWSADSRQLVFVAPHQQPPGGSFGWLQPQPSHALLVASATDPSPPFPIGDTDVDLAAWREDGQVLGLGRQGTDGGLVMSVLDGSARGQRVFELPLKPVGGYAATWDLRRGRLLIATPNATGGADFWLASLGLENNL